MATCAYCSRDLGTDTSNNTTAGVVVCGGCFNLNRVGGSNGSARVDGVGGIRTVEELAPEGSVMRDVFSSVTRAIDRLPVLPEIPRRVVVLAHDPMTSMPDLAEFIHEDAGLSMRVLRRANSAGASPVSPIKDVRQACTQIGLKAVVQLAQAEMTAALYRDCPTQIRFLAQRLWRHNVVTACLADRIASMANVHDRDPAFMAGLIHDVGKLILLDVILNVHRGRVGRLEDDTELLSRVLVQFAPWVGAYVVQQWRMPSEFVMATFFSSQPALVPEGMSAELSHVVRLASDMAAEAGYDLFDAPPTQSNVRAESVHPSAEALHLIPERCISIAADIASAADDLIDVPALS